MPLPPPQEVEIENEIEIHSLGLNNATGKLEYLVGIEVELFESNSPAQCTCALNLGGNNLLPPPSVVVSQAIIGISNQLTHELEGQEDEFEFEDENEIENELENEFESGSRTFGFAVEVDGVQSEPLQADDVHALLFKVEVAPSDLPALRNIPIRFAAGSDMPGHPLKVLNGYQTVLNLPGLTTDFTWDGRGDGQWNQDRWNAAGAYPTQGTHATVLQDQVTVAGLQQADSTSVTSGELLVVGTLNGDLEVLTAGRLSGSGRVQGTVSNHGAVTPSSVAGTLSFDGDFTQTASGRLELAIREPASQVSMSVSGTLTLAGTLELLSPPGPDEGPLQRGDRLDFPLIAAGQIVGSLDEVKLDGTPLGAVADGNETRFQRHRGDGQFDSLRIGVDAVTYSRYLAQPGDANGDGQFDSTDLTQVFQIGQYEDGQVENSDWLSGDWNGDLDFDTADLVLAFQTGTYESAAQVPEPAGTSLAILACLLGLIPRRRGQIQGAGGTKRLG